MADPEQTICDWLDGCFGSEQLPRLLDLTPRQGERIRQAAERAALTAHRRILDSRQMRMRLYGLPISEDVDERTSVVLRAWLRGRITAEAAADLIGTTPSRLVALARERGVSR